MSTVRTLTVAVVLCCACPHCGSQRCVPVAYGLPGIDLQAEAERGDVILGGCVIWEGQPDWACTVCGFEWHEADPRRR